MAVNPSKIGEPIKSPIERANQVNDPNFENQQGYYPYDLTHQEFLSPRFGEITPCMHLNTVPADRIVCVDNTKTILNQINGNLLSKVNQYVDTFYVPKRCIYPNNYEKLIPNPTKGDDLPNAALPMFPIGALVYSYLRSVTLSVRLLWPEQGTDDTRTIKDIMASADDDYSISRMYLLSTILSRGQLLDYLGVQFDNRFENNKSRLQSLIDSFQRAVYLAISSNDGFNENGRYIYRFNRELTDNLVDYEQSLSSGFARKITNLSEFRDVVSDIFESGYLPFFNFTTSGVDMTGITESYYSLYAELISLFGTVYLYDEDTFINDLNTSEDPFRSGYISLDKPMAYQLLVAQYFTNNTVDNIFNSDLYLQLLRSVMFPANPDTGFSLEPTFLYNGVSTEYDLITPGAASFSLLTDSLITGAVHRQEVFMTLLFMLRRSLRYGDYFTTARPNMLAVGQLSINVENGMVSPVDVTRNLLAQRYLNAANYIGSGFLPYYNSIFGVTPSDTGTFPRFISHRKISLDNQITNNTGDNQGYQTTNLLGYTDEKLGFDVFIDDFGVIISTISYDVLPVYTSGFDADLFMADRFDMFNPMMQNMGDQPIMLSELIGDFSLRGTIFGYTMRDSQYKFKNSRAHGAFVNSLPGFLVKYPLDRFIPRDTFYASLEISPDFIRDKPVYLDATVPVSTGVSPAEYFHFLVSVTNQVNTARKITATPPILF